MKNLESRLQIQCVKWFRYQYPELIIFSIPNGGHRNPVTAKIMKAEGVLSGVADLFLAYPSKGYNGYFIEMKISKGKQSENQKIFQENIVKYQYKYDIAYNFEDFMTLINEYIG